MSNETLPEERTEMPTSKRMSQLREQGALHMSPDVVQVLTLIIAFKVLHVTWQWMIESLKITYRYCIELARQREPFELNDFGSAFIYIGKETLPPVILLVLAVSTVAFFAVMLQTDWNIKKHKIDFKPNMINPMAGIKRIFSLQNLLNIGKGLLKIIIIIPIGAFVLVGYADEMVKLIHTSVIDVFHYAGMAMNDIFWQVVTVLVIIAIFDWVIGKMLWLRQNKMTKNEVKDELKAQEGDEQTKRRMLAVGMGRLKKMIMQSVPRADVVIVNPTHYAVALQYDRSTMKAPQVLAKGRDYLALRIREIARENGIPIVERKTLARALYDSCREGAEIPFELFRAVAEVLAYVYRIKGKVTGSTERRGVAS